MGRVLVGVTLGLMTALHRVVPALMTPRDAIRLIVVCGSTRGGMTITTCESTHVSTRPMVRRCAPCWITYATTVFQVRESLLWPRLRVTPLLTVT
ncbi:MAG: hypothetical protein ACK5O2_17525, partial [Microthrixaceae bacterium]